MPAGVTVLVAAFLLLGVHPEELLFRKGHIRYAPHGRRTLRRNATALDPRTVDPSRTFLLVKTRSMPVLHPRGVADLPLLRDLVMAGCGIRVVSSGAFSGLPNLTSLHLQDNEIRAVERGVFNGLPLRTLCLQRNAIRAVEGAAFDDMPNLFKIQLNYNRLKAWDSEWFKACPRLTELFFRRNRIRSLPAFAFANVRGSHRVDGRVVVDTKIFLSKNKLAVIEPRSFYNLTAVSQLYLDRNNVSEVPEEAFRDLEEVDVVYLARNRIGRISERAFPKVRRIGILDVSSNRLDCLPLGLVAAADMTNLERNNDAACECASNYEGVFREMNKTNEITCQNRSFEE